MPDRPTMTDAEWSMLIKILVAGATKLGKIDDATKLVCKLAAIIVHGKIDAAGFEGALKLLRGRKSYRLAGSQRILAEVQ